VSGICRDPWKINQKTTSQLQNGQDLKRHVIREDTQLANKHMKRDSYHKPTGKCKMKPLRHHYTCQKGYVKQPNSQQCRLSDLASGNAKWNSHCESLATSQNLKELPNTGPGNATPQYLP
jgi:hypothetical protein